MRIGITGVPGSGKTTLAKRLSSKLGLEYIDVKKIVRDYRLGAEVDTDVLQKLLNNLLRGKDNYVVESHLLVEMELDFIDLMIVTRASYRSLLRRYRKRGYDQDIIWDNIAAELQDYFTLSLRNVKFIQIDTTGLSIRELERKAMNYISHNLTDNVDWSEDLLRLAIRGKI